MIDARLPLLADGSGKALSDGGRVAVFRPPAQAALPGVPQDKTVIIEGFRPAYDAWTARGYECATAAEGRFSAAVVCLVRSKDESRALIADALAVTDGPVFIDGQKTDGIDSILREVRNRVPVEGPVSKAHGKLFVIPGAAPEQFEDWRAGPALQPGGFWTAPGVFSADAVDPASDLLVRALPDKIGRRIVDLGAGWGYLSAHILTREAVEAVHLVEAGHMALECARHNVTDPRAQFHWADATRWRPQEAVDCVIMNPPFHTSRAADPALGQAFVAAAAGMLGPQGQLWMVANRHLPYEATLGSFFSRVSETGGDHRFKLFHAARPLRKRGR
ncbi:class I SAM-dependent methyltransferase [Roseobacter ponti]|uniref:Class I SAM-dependent methyltransferase n=1 Tax=Roseobacter ponti TaxID=1891787 RepID=A0A858SXA8_9RHOB|nr:methyltransferase [Roseobacter ponti]QJF52687.1 class I SAM-dependent methyltransferase [Roseobacter ponti]